MMKPEIDMSKIAKNIEIEIKVKNKNKTDIRMKLGMLVMKLAAYIMPVTVNIEMESVE